MKQKYFFRMMEKVYTKAKSSLRKRGVFCTVWTGINIFLINSFHYYYYRIFKPSRTFIFRGQTYNYFYHTYNRTWMDERAIEIPIIWDIVKKYPEQNILEVGNVLSHYFCINHDILDKYEKGEGVINQDVVDFQTSKRYKLIVSISTLEHVGWDESPREPKKILQAIQNLKQLLAPNGKIIVTLPLGSNADLDTLLQNKRLPFTKQYYLKRISRDNKWVEVSWKDIYKTKYNRPFPNANGLIIGIIEKNDHNL